MEMVKAIVNGRQMTFPSNTNEQEIRRAGGIGTQRNLIQRRREGNFMVPRGSSVVVKDGDVFIDAPKRIKG